jgi:hypothetical protein
MLFDKHIASPPIAINAMLDFFQRTLAQRSPSSSAALRKDDPKCYNNIGLPAIPLEKHVFSKPYQRVLHQREQGITRKVRYHWQQVI